MTTKARPRYSTPSLDEVKVGNQEPAIASESPTFGTIRRGHRLNPRGIRRGIREMIQNGGAWEINVGGLSGTLADGQTPAAHATSHQNNGTDEVSVTGLSGLLADQQTPLTHDIITKHNGFPGGTTNFLRADGSFAAPPAAYTDEQAQDAVGNILIPSTTVTPTYDDVTPDISFDINNASIANHHLEDMAAASFKGNPTGSPQAPGDIGLASLGAITPAAGDFLLIWEGGSGLLAKADVGDLPGGAGAAPDITDGTTTVTAPAEIQFNGTDFVVTNNGGDAAVTIGTVSIANGGTGQTSQTPAFDALSPLTTAGDVIYHNGTDNVRLGIGTAGQVLTTNGAATAPAWAANQGAYKKVETTADVAINSVTDITVATEDVITIATEQIKVDAWFVILNNSGATRVYAITMEFDGTTFDIEISTAALATSSTLMHPFHLEAIVDIRSSSLAYAMVELNGYIAAGLAGGGDTTMAATHPRGTGWGTTANDLTGTTTCHLKIRSADATATQTCRVHHFSARKLTPT